MLHGQGQFLDAHYGLLNHQRALIRLPVGLIGGAGCGFGVACHILHGGDHFVHGGGDLFGFQLLPGNAGAALLRDRGHFLGSGRQLFNAAAQASEQVAQAQGHGLHGLHQHAQLVFTVAEDVLRKVAVSDLAGQAHHALQRHDDHPGNQQGGQQAHDETHQGRHA
ncbi:hypothetical protein D3C87_1607460 [compost metagenome]